MFFLSLGAGGFVFGLFRVLGFWLFRGLQFGGLGVWGLRGLGLKTP